MASPPCMSGDGETATFVGTMLATGDAVALCDACLVPWTAAVLQAMTGIDPEPFLRAISDENAPDDTAGGDTDGEATASADFTEDPPPPPGRAGRMSRVLAEAGTAGDPAEDGEPTDDETASSAA